MNPESMDPLVVRGKSRVWLVRYAIVAASIVALGLGFAARGNRPRIIVEPEAITIATVRNDLFQDYVAVQGTVEPIQTVYLDATEGGRVEEIFVREGAAVKKGDRILRLSNDNLLLGIANYETGVARAVNDLRSMQVTLENQQHQNQVQLLDCQHELCKLERRLRISERLMAEQISSKEDYTLCKENYESKKKLLDLLTSKSVADSAAFTARVAASTEMVTSMQKNLNVNRARLDKLLITAPFDGELASLVPELGQVIPYGSRLGTIHILDSYKVKVEVGENYVGRVRLKQQADCEFWSREYPAVVSKVYPEVKVGKFGVDLVFTDQKLPSDLRIGQTARVRIRLGQAEKTLMVPRGGFYQSTGGQWIFVLDKESRIAHRRAIRIGRQNLEMYEVVSGLSEGEEVIVSDYKAFGHNQELAVAE